MGQTLLFESRKGLYAVPWPHQGTDKPRRIAELSPPEYAEANWWAVSPDGRHIAYFSQRISDLRAAAVPKPSPFDSPSVVRVATLPGMRGDRILFSLPGQEVDDKTPFFVAPHALRSANGSVVKSLDDDAENLGNWRAIDLALCPDSRTLLLSLRQLLPGDMPVFVTCAVDLRRGHAMHVDRDGIWHSLIPSMNISVRNHVLLGVGVGRTTDEMMACNSCSQFYPIDVSEWSRPDSNRRLLSATFDSKHIPSYGLAQYPTLSPDGRTIAFYSYASHDITKGDPGIWTVDRHTRHYHRLTHDRDVCQLVWESPASLLLLKRTGKPDERGSVDLFRLPLHDHSRRAGKPVFLLPNIDRIQLLDRAL